MKFSMMKTVYLTLLILVPYFFYVSSTTSSLVLNNAWTVEAGQCATYNCTSDGDGVNPIIKWSIRTIDGTIVRSNDQLSSQVVDGSSVQDGVIKNSVTFTVQSSFLSNHRLWCSVVDAGQSSPTMQIYTAIAATKNNKDIRPDYKPDKSKSEGSEEKDQEKVPITSIVLGILCLLVTCYAIGLTILYKRNINRKGTNTSYRREVETGTDNVGISTDAKEEQEYKINAAENNEESSHQYTELQHNSFDKTTYEQLSV